MTAGRVPARWSDMMNALRPTSLANFGRPIADSDAWATCPICAERQSLLVAASREQSGRRVYRCRSGCAVLTRCYREGGSYSMDNEVEIEMVIPPPPQPAADPAE